MLGLIYPAVLGTLLYQLVFTIAHALREQYPLSANRLDQMDPGCDLDRILRL